MIGLRRCLIFVTKDLDFHRFCQYGRRCVSSAASAGSSDEIISPKVPQSPQQLVEFVKKHAVWVTDDFIASVKPSGIAAYGVPWSYILQQRWNVEKDEMGESLPFDTWDETGSEDYEENEKSNKLTITSILPELKSIFGGDELTIVKTVPSCYQGPLLFARNKKAVKATARALTIRDDGGMIFFLLKSLNVCVGKPKYDKGEAWCYAKGEIFNEEGSKRYTLSPTPPPSVRSVMRGVMKRGYFRYRVLAYDESTDCSLIELEMKKMQHQLDRLFLLDHGCPVLGDIFHQVCNARILGQPIYVPHNRASIKNQYIPTGLLKKLRISLAEYHRLPLFAHVHTMHLPELLRTGKKRQDVELQAPMPAYFSSLLQEFDWLRIVEEDEKRQREQGEFVNETAKM